eukprot:TRINITY_DN2000_c0_g1_i4.p1 TRINITY_DN2000_c0_g1~~TRINITY_DN2000_c0_g1_i4.p1  ORF type:complete len:166 (-),score=39.84 TRINITY_DN2000_c0_g1_i4:133-630(-)
MARGEEQSIEKWKSWERTRLRSLWRAQNQISQTKETQDTLPKKYLYPSELKGRGLVSTYPLVSKEEIKRVINDELGHATPVLEMTSQYLERDPFDESSQPDQNQTNQLYQELNDSVSNLLKVAKEFYDLKEKERSEKKAGSKSQNALGKLIKPFSLPSLFSFGSK